MAIDTRSKRQAVAGAGRPFMRSVFPNSLDAEVRSNVGLSYPVADFQDIPDAPESNAGSYIYRRRRRL